MRKIIIPVAIVSFALTTLPSCTGLQEVANQIGQVSTNGTLGQNQIGSALKEALQQGDKNYEGLMLFALELTKKPTRTEISEITRVFNRISQKMPVAMVLKYAIEKEAIISIAISERFKYLQNWRQGEKTGKVIILRDIHTKPENTHAGHQRILLDLVKPTGDTNEYLSIYSRNSRNRVLISN